MKNVFLFPGQGAQKKGMIKEVCDVFPVAMDVVKMAEKVTGENISDYLWNIEDELLARSDRSQLAITTASIALIKVMQFFGVEADLCAGFSLGEFAALYCAGVLTFEETMILVQKRGKIMQKVCDEIANQGDCCEGCMPGMAAVIGLTPQQVIEAIEPLTKKNIAFASNLNSPKQTVVSGTFEGLNQAEKLCLEKGARRFIRLKVAGPFHSPLMERAGVMFESELDKVTFKNPVKRLFSNVTGKEISLGEEAKKLAVKHFTNPVCWTSEEAEIAKIINFENENVFSEWKIYETGPGNVLSGLWRDSGFSANIGCNAVNTFESISALR